MPYYSNEAQSFTILQKYYGATCATLHANTEKLQTTTRNVKKERHEVHKRRNFENTQKSDQNIVRCGCPLDHLNVSPWTTTGCFSQRPERFPLASNQTTGQTGTHPKCILSELRRFTRVIRRSFLHIRKPSSTEWTKTDQAKEHLWRRLR